MGEGIFRDDLLKLSDNICSFWNAKCKRMCWFILSLLSDPWSLSTLDFSSPWLPPPVFGELSKALLILLQPLHKPCYTDLFGSVSQRKQTALTDSW